jgi:MTH538 TIR-like domain (DUF1863)
MAYRNGTYIAFHAEGNTDPTASDIKYFNMMKAWHHNDDIDFKFVDSHEKTYSVRDTSAKATLRNRLKERLGGSKNMVLIVGSNTRFDTDWVPFEIEYAVDNCNIPIICTYPNIKAAILDTSPYRALWPTALRTRIDNDTARTVHIPFGQALIDRAVRAYSCHKMPGWTQTVFKAEVYRECGWQV